MAFCVSYSMEDVLDTISQDENSDLDEYSDEDNIDFEDVDIDGSEGSLEGGNSGKDESRVHQSHASGTCATAPTPRNTTKANNIYPSTLCQNLMIPALMIQKI